MNVLRALFRIITFPGWLVAKIGYLWPGRNQITASERRLDSQFAHFVYTIPVVLFGAWVAAAINAGPQKPDQPAEPSAKWAGALDAGRTDTAAEIINGGAAEVQKLYKPEEAGKAVVLDDGPAPAREAAAEEPAPTPDTVKELADAIEEAGRERHMVRWTGSGHAGYAVPSDTTTAPECVNVSWSVDKIDGGKAQGTVQRCRE